MFKVCPLTLSSPPPRFNNVLKDQQLSVMGAQNSTLFGGGEGRGQFDSYHDEYPNL